MKVRKLYKKILNIKLYDTTNTGDNNIQNYLLSFNSMNNSNNISKISESLRSAIGMYDLSNMSLLSVYVNKNENILIISELINSCKILGVHLVLNMYDTHSNKTFYVPIVDPYVRKENKNYVKRLKNYCKLIGLELEVG